MNNDINLKVNIAGLELKNPVIAASGTFDLAGNTADILI